MSRPTQPGHSVVAAPLSSQPLCELLAHDIRAAGGWIPFDRFMHLALYAPGLGYYSGGRRVIGHLPQDGSDFVTAPELTPLFGEVLARQLEEALAATQTDQIWEFGAGSGALACALLDALGEQLSRYTIVEVSGALRDRQHARILREHPGLAHKVVWADALPDRFEGVLVGNEVLDAMPVSLLHWDGQAWLQRGVSLADAAPAVTNETQRFAWADRPSDTPGARPETERDDAEFIPGTVVETHSQAEAFITTLAAGLQRGAAFFIDYGFPEAEYYHPQRTGGTLMCHHAHTSDADPLVGIGEKDITAHVNFTGIALAGQNAGWEVLGYTSQGRFLANCGLGEAMARVSTQQTVQALRDQVAMNRLIADHEMGELFKVIGFVKGPWFEAKGFQSGDRTHTL
jgi:SAM-dependent MidA family methyltransferase